MTEAWMKRGAERQEFLDTLKRMIIDEEDESHKRLQVQIPFSVAILAYLTQKEKLNAVFTCDWKRGEFLRKILKEIDEFARTPEEALALVADLLEWEATSIANHFRQPLKVQETIEPEKVFDGHRAMDKID